MCTNDLIIILEWEDDGKCLQKSKRKYRTYENKPGLALHSTLLCLS